MENKENIINELIAKRTAYRNNYIEAKKQVSALLSENKNLYNQLRIEINSNQSPEEIDNKISELTNNLEDETKLQFIEAYGKMIKNASLIKQINNEIDKLNKNEQNQDEQNQDEQNQDEQNQDEQNQDEQNQDEQNQDGQNQDGQNQDEQEQDEQDQDEKKPKEGRIINGAKSVGKFTGKYGLKGLAKTGEIVGRGATILPATLLKNEEFQVIATTAGLITASVSFPPFGLGLMGFVAAKKLANEILGKDTSVIDEVRSTILLGNKITEKVGNVLGDLLEKGHDGIKDLGDKTQEGIDKMFESKQNDDYQRD